MSAQGRITAFFDLDGTLVAPPSLEYRFAMYLMQRGELQFASVLKWLKVFLKEGARSLVVGAGTTSRLKAIDENKNYLAGVRESSAEEWAERNIASIECYTDAVERVAWHREQAHAIVFVSGTIAPLACAMAERIARGSEIGVVATELEGVGGRWTGQAVGAAICGTVKARAVRALEAGHDINLAGS